MEKIQRAGLRKAVMILSLLLCAGMCAAVGVPMVRLAREPEAFRIWVAGFGIWGRVIYVAAVAAQVVLAVIPGEPLELAGGYAFGGLEGTVLALGGIVLGSAAVYALVRRFGRGAAAGSSFISSVFLPCIPGGNRAALRRRKGPSAPLPAPPDRILRFRLRRRSRWSR